MAAASAYSTYRNLSAAKRAGFLDAIADELDALGDSFVALVCRETALPAARIQGERSRVQDAGLLALRSLLGQTPVTVFEPHDIVFA